MPEPTSAELSNVISDLENQLKDAINSLEVVSEEEYRLSREILTLQLKKKDVSHSVEKAKSVIKRLQLEKSIATKRFWNAKESGI